MPEDSPGIAGQVYEAVTKWALEATGIPQNWTTPLWQLKVDIWRSPRGRKLKALYTDANTHGDKVEKADRHRPRRIRLVAGSRGLHAEACQPRHGGPGAGGYLFG